MAKLLGGQAYSFASAELSMFSKERRTYRKRCHFQRNCCRNGSLWLLEFVYSIKRTNPTVGPAGRNSYGLVNGRTAIGSVPEVLESTEEHEEEIKIHRYQ